MPGGGGWNGNGGGGDGGDLSRQQGGRRGRGGAGGRNGGGGNGGGGFDNGGGQFYESTFYPDGNPAFAVAVAAAAALAPSVSASSSSPVSLRPAGSADAFPCSKADAAASLSSKEKPVARNLSEEIAGVSSEKKKEKEGFEKSE